MKLCYMHYSRGDDGDEWDDVQDAGCHEGADMHYSGGDEGDKGAHMDDSGGE